MAVRVKERQGRWLRGEAHVMDEERGVIPSGADECARSYFSEARPYRAIHDHVFKEHVVWPYPEPSFAIKGFVNNQRFYRFAVLGEADDLVFFAIIMLVGAEDCVCHGVDRVTYFPLTTALPVP